MGIKQTEGTNRKTCTSAQSYLWHPFPGQCKIEHIIITFDFLRRIIFIVFIHSSGTCRITHDCINSFTFFNREQPVTSHYCEIPLQITEYVRVVWEKRGELLFISLKRWSWSKKLGVKYSKRVKAEILKALLLRQTAVCCWESQTCATSQCWCRYTFLSYHYTWLTGWNNMRIFSQKIQRNVKPSTPMEFGVKDKE